MASIPPTTSPTTGARAASDGLPVYHSANDRHVDPRTNVTRAIYLPTEFLHGLYDGGAGAGLEDYWTMMRAGPLRPVEDSSGRCWTKV